MITNSPDDKKKASPSRPDAHQKLRLDISKISIVPIRRLTGQDMDGSIGMTETQLDAIMQAVDEFVEMTKSPYGERSSKGLDQSASPDHEHTLSSDAERCEACK